MGRRQIGVEIVDGTLQSGRIGSPGSSKLSTTRLRRTATRENSAATKESIGSDKAQNGEYPQKIENKKCCHQYWTWSPPPCATCSSIVSVGTNTCRQISGLTPSNQTLICTSSPPCEPSGAASSLGSCRFVRHFIPPRYHPAECPVEATPHTSSCSLSRVRQAVGAGDRFHLIRPAPQPSCRVACSR